jgi:putative transposase
MRKDFDMFAQYIPSACEVTGGILKNFRKVLRQKPDAKIPYAKRLMLKAENQAYKLDRQTGLLDFPIRKGEHIKIQLELSPYHLNTLLDESYSLGSLTITPYKIIVAMRKPSPKPYEPESIISLDTNERSLDGIFVKDKKIKAIKIDFSQIPIIQERHVERRTKLQKKKSHDRRLKRKLCGREGRRVHNRITNKLYTVANLVVNNARKNKSAIALENLTGLTLKHKSKKLNRRISSWSRRTLHDIISYKAEGFGVPIIQVNPKNTSRTCPKCGCVNRKTRLDNEFKCKCGWHLDRHLNASLNLLQKAIETNSLARGIRFCPDAFQHDTMKILYEPAMVARLESNGMSCYNLS